MAAPELNRELFQPVHIDREQAETISRPALTYWQDAWIRLKRNRTAMAGMVVLLVIIVAAMIFPARASFLPNWWPGNLYTYSDQNLNEISVPPGGAHWIGTDDLGRDLWVRLWTGARLSLTIGVSAALVDLLIGIVYGGIAGYVGGTVDDVMMRIVEILYGIPYLIMVILLSLIFRPTSASLLSAVMPLLLALTILGWIGVARLVRGQVLQLRNQEFVLAAQVLGADSWRIIAKHLLPNVIGPIIVWVTLDIPAVIFSEAFLSFVGLGVPMPFASWGTLASNGYQFMRIWPWFIIYPSTAIAVTMLSFNLFGDGLRDALDPRMRK
ncbi:MAG: ABC transporter permease [Bacillota bacterium]